MYLRFVISSKWSNDISAFGRIPAAIPNGLQFSVQGFKFKGKVRVIYNEGLDLFTVELIKRGGKTYKTFNEVYFDNLVSLIDREVEYCENYDKKVANQYSII